MEKTKIVTQTDQRPFTIIYHDFLESDLLETAYQKLVFIYLKKFSDSKNQCFPSVKTLSKLTKISETKVKTTLAELKDKGVIKKENRTRVDGGKSSNLYTLYDYAELWEESKKEEENCIDEYEDKRLIKLLELRGYKVTKEKEPESSKMPTKAEKETDSNKTSLDKNYKAENNDCQEKCEKQEKKQEIKEKYPFEFLQELYEYETMIFDNENLQTDINAAFRVLYEALNTTKETIRIKSENKPTQAVINKLMKLTRFGILYAIEKYKEQTNRIDNSTGYLLTLLYGAEEQMHLDIINRVQYDMTHQKQIEEVKKQQQNYEENQPVNQKQQLIEEYNSYSQEEKDGIRNKYVEIMFKGNFDKKGTISDLEKEWSNPREKIEEQGKK